MVIFFHEEIVVKRNSTKKGHLLRKLLSRKIFLSYLLSMVEIKYLRKKEKYTVYKYKLLDIGEEKIKEMKKELMLFKLTKN